MFATSRGHPHPRVPMSQPRRSASYLERPQVIKMFSPDEKRGIEDDRKRKANRHLAAVINSKIGDIQYEISSKIKLREWRFSLNEIPHKNAEIIAGQFKRLGFNVTFEQAYMDVGNRYNPAVLTIALPLEKPSADLQAQFLPHFNPDVLWKQLNNEYKNSYIALHKEVTKVIEDTDNYENIKLLIDDYDPIVINWVIDDLKENGYSAKTNRWGPHNYLRIGFDKV